jgi:hypothetical protein
MKASIEYLDEAKAKVGIESDYGFAKHVGITRGAMSNYRNKVSVMDDYTATKIAEALEINPMVVIAAANAEREKDGEKKDYWQKYWSRLGGMAAAILIAFVTLIVTLGHSTPLQAASLQASQAINISLLSPVIHYAK